MVKRIKMPPGQWSEDFIAKMQARMFIGFYRYGDTKRYAESGRYDLLKTIEKYLNAYQEDGNLEHLVNIANYCQIEFMYPQNPKAHFESLEFEERDARRIGVVETLIRVDEEEERNLKGDYRNVLS